MGFFSEILTDSFAQKKYKKGLVFCQTLHHRSERLWQIL
jgi:hypothetical protein